MAEYSAEDELRHGVAESLARLGIKIVSTAKRGKPCIKHGTRKPSLRAMANESTRTRDEHEKCLSDLMTTIPANADDMISQESVDVSTLRAVLWLMRHSATKPQCKLFSK